MRVLLRPRAFTGRSESPQPQVESGGAVLRISASYASGQFRLRVTNDTMAASWIPISSVSVDPVLKSRGYLLGRTKPSAQHVSWGHCQNSRRAAFKGGQHSTSASFGHWQLPSLQSGFYALHSRCVVVSAVNGSRGPLSSESTGSCSTTRLAPS